MLLILVILLFIVLAMIRSTKSKIDQLENERVSFEDQEHIERNEAVLEKYRTKLNGLEAGLIVILIAMLGVFILLVTLIIS